MKRQNINLLKSTLNRNISFIFMHALRFIFFFFFLCTEKFLFPSTRFPVMETGFEFTLSLTLFLLMRTYLASTPRYSLRILGTILRVYVLCIVYHTFRSPRFWFFFVGPLCFRFLLNINHGYIHTENMQ